MTEDYFFVTFLLECFNFHVHNYTLVDEGILVLELLFSSLLIIGSLLRTFILVFGDDVMSQCNL
jgi:hypothetical protein